jgi:hypothetical protein
LLKFPWGCFLVFLCSGVFAQESLAERFSLGLGLEGNVNTLESFAMGAIGQVDYSFLPFLQAGFKGTFSYSFDGIASAEPEIFLRWSPKLGPGRLFVQAGAGAAFYFKDGVLGYFLGEGVLGYRAPLGDAGWYIEPYLRGGYPFLAGAGIMFGLSPRRGAAAGRNSDT